MRFCFQINYPKVHSKTEKKNRSIQTFQITRIKLPSLQQWSSKNNEGVRKQRGEQEAALPANLVLGNP